jgi:internalin A
MDDHSAVTVLAIVWAQFSHALIPWIPIASPIPVTPMHDETGQDKSNASRSAARPRKRLRGLSIRMLMLVVLVVGGGLGWICHRARVQREAVAAIRAAGGDVAFDWQWDPASSKPMSGSPNPGWLRRQLGPGFFEEVLVVTVLEADDSLMIHVGRFHHLQRLGIFGGNVTDSGLAPIENLHFLDRLWLSGTCITDAGIVHLHGLTALTDLSLDGTRIADEGLRSLAGLSRLGRLSLDNTGITDAGLAAIARLTNLQFRTVHNTGITDAGIAHLSGLRSCKGIEVYGTKVTREGAAAMRRKCPWMTIIP